MKKTLKRSVLSSVFFCFLIHAWTNCLCIHPNMSLAPRWTFVAIILAQIFWMSVLSTRVHEKSRCATKSACNEGGQGDFLQACVSNSEPFVFEVENEEDSEAFYFLNSVCPHLTKSRSPEICCDTTQLLQLKDQMATVRMLFRRCPSCLQNFESLWCNLLCHPDQSTFSNVTATVPYSSELKASSKWSDADGKWSEDSPPEYSESVDAVTIYLSRDYAHNLYRSCAHVKFIGASQEVISKMCFENPVDKCSPELFLNYIGTKKNKRSPSEFTFEIVEDNQRAKYAEKGIHPLDLDLFQCNARGYNNSEPCSCMDCPQSCKGPPRGPNPGAPLDSSNPPWRLLGIPGYVVVVAVLYITVSCIYIVVSYMHCLYYKKPDDEDQYVAAPNYNYHQQHSQYISKSTVQNCSSKNSMNSDGGGDGTNQTQGSGGGVVVVEVGVFEQIGRRFQSALHSFFFQWGLTMACQPVAALLFGSMVVAVCSNGLHYVRWTTDPVELWSSSGSEAYREMEHFNSHFGPFFRIEQIIVKLKRNATGAIRYEPDAYSERYRPKDMDPIMDAPILHQVLSLQENISNLTVYSTRHERNVTLSDICHKPMAPANDKCAIMSVTEWFQNSHETIDEKSYRTRRKRVINADHYKHIRACIESPTRLDDGTPLRTSCLASWGGIMEPLIVLGGFKDSIRHLLDDPKHKEEFEKATALVVTILVKNSLNSREREIAEDFEQRSLKRSTAVSFKEWNSSLIFAVFPGKIYLDLVRQFALDHPHLHVAYQAQRSIEDEIERASEGDVKTVICSYLIMFGYITCCLGKVGGCGMRTLVDMKITVGIGGVVIVMSSVACSIGVFGFIGVPATLIIMEVVPFLVLAVGVDNIFILVQCYQRYRPKDRNESLEVQIATVFSKVAPSMLLSSCAEALAFFLGAMTPMPAVRTFSLYAGMAVTFDFLFQITCFVGLLTLDAKRQKDARVDIACCVPVDNCEKSPRGQVGTVYSLFKNYYSPILFSDLVRPIVIVVFVGWFLACCCMMPHIPIGLDQSLSLPSDSYMRDYFTAISEDLNVGSPVYFVVKEPFPYEDPQQQKLVCGLAGCSADSIVQQISRAAKDKERTKIAKMPNSWLDDFLDWSDPESKCCRFDTTSDSGGRKFCNASVQSENCESCPIDGGKVQGEQFMDLLPYFLSDIPSIDCPKAGKAAYANGVSIKSVWTPPPLITSSTLVNGSQGSWSTKNLAYSADNLQYSSSSPPYSKTEEQSNKGEYKKRVVSSYFMTYHTALRTSADFTEALVESRALADRISESMGVEVYPYSVFYVFYEQYLSIVRDTVINMSVSLLSIFLVTFFLLGLDIVSALFVGVTILMIIVSMCGLMYLWDISLNAISLVNLVMAVGISVEFSAHTVRTFAVNPNPSRLQRAKDSLLEMGSSVLSGITLTKLGGILVLGFSNSELFRVFYFRMYLGIVIFGAAHGLAFLPVVLSYIGPLTKERKLRRTNRKCRGCTCSTGTQRSKGAQGQRNPRPGITDPHLPTPQQEDTHSLVYTKSLPEQSKQTTVVTSNAETSNSELSATILTTVSKNEQRLGKNSSFCEATSISKDKSQPIPDCIEPTVFSSNVIGQKSANENRSACNTETDAPIGDKNNEKDLFESGAMFSKASAPLKNSTSKSNHPRTANLDSSREETCA